MTARVITRYPDLLQNVEHKFFIIPKKIIKNNSEGMNWSIPVDELLIGCDWYLEKYQIINQSPNNSIIVDAGCKSGDWISVIKHLIPNTVKSIGIDPINYNIMHNYVDYYHSVALDNIDYPTTMTFHLFDEPGCNSLLPKSDHLTMRNIINTITVPVQTLESILLEHVVPGTFIQYVKCDCQGKDIDVIKSLRSFLPFTKYIQMELSFSYEKPFYNGQKSYEDDIETMLKLGFEPLYWTEYPESPLPEGEILFKNKEMV
jgi:FkbM family methyltransferase